MADAEYSGRYRSLSGRPNHGVQRTGDAPAKGIQISVRWRVACRRNRSLGAWRLKASDENQNFLVSRSANLHGLL